MDETRRLCRLAEEPSAKQWSFCISYEHGPRKAMYPDLVLVRKAKNGFVVDVVEPHRTNEDDTFAKAKGLAQYAEDHGEGFGRLMMLKVEDEGEKAVVFGFDINDPSTRKKALRLRSNEDVQGLFQPLGFYGCICVYRRSHSGKKRCAVV